MNSVRFSFINQVLTILLLLLTMNAQADRIGYSSVIDLKTESVKLIVEHHHDWSASTDDARWKMISSDENLFTEQNNYSFLKVTSKGKKITSFKVPVPALSYLWISPDDKFIVGISNIKSWNPIQIVVFNSRGSLLLAKAVKTSSFTGVSESVSNWVYWYKEPTPSIFVEQSTLAYILKVEGNNGEARIFEFWDK